MYNNKCFNSLCYNLLFMGLIDISLFTMNINIQCTSYNEHGVDY